MITDKLFYDTENEWLFTEEKFEYTDKTNKINANRLDSNRDFTDLVTGNLTGSINNRLMRNFLISEIIYWVIAVISLFSVIENWTINSDRAYIF